MRAVLLYNVEQKQPGGRQPCRKSRQAFPNCCTSSRRPKRRKTPIINTRVRSHSYNLRLLWKYIIPQKKYISRCCLWPSVLLIFPYGFAILLPRFRIFHRIYVNPIENHQFDIDPPKIIDFKECVHYAASQRIKE